MHSPQFAASSVHHFFPGQHRRLCYKNVKQHSKRKREVEFAVAVRNILGLMWVTNRVGDNEGLLLSEPTVTNCTIYAVLLDALFKPYLSKELAFYTFEKEGFVKNVRAGLFLKNQYTKSWWKSCFMASVQRLICRQKHVLPWLRS